MAEGDISSAVAGFLSALPRGDEVVGVEVLWWSTECPAEATKDDIADAAKAIGRCSEMYGVRYLTEVDRKGTLERLGFMVRRDEPS